MWPHRARGGTLCAGRCGKAVVAGRSTESLDVMQKQTHADGTPCVEGTQNVPRGFIPCCESFEAGTKACEFDIRFEWWPKSKHWVIRVPDGGTSGLEISYCPYCGGNLSERAKRKRA